MLNMISIFMKFTKAHLVAWHAVSPVECSVCTREECVVCCFWMEYSINITFIWSKVSFKACVSLLIFCLDDLSIDGSGVLKSPTITVVFKKLLYYCQFLLLWLLVFVLHIKVFLCFWVHI